MLNELSRRAFVVSSLASGFALAVRPTAAATPVATDASGLVAGEVKIGGMPAYRAMPEGKGPFPLVLVVHEVFGVHEHIKDICRRLAKAGYMAVAPELFARQGDVSKLEKIDEVLKIAYKAPDAQVFGDLDATLAWAKTTGKVDGARVGVTGFCWGGRITWLYAGRSAGKVKAGVAWYGRLSHAINAQQTSTPLDLGAKLTVPVLGLYGGKDEGIPVAHVEMMRRALANGKSGSEIVVYPHAGHAFNADYRPSYDKAAADDAWPKLLDWFKKHGV